MTVSRFTWHKDPIHRRPRRRSPRRTPHREIWVGQHAEAQRIIDNPRARHPDIPAMDLWWLRSRALLAKAEGDAAGHAELANQYLSLCKSSTPVADSTRRDKWSIGSTENCRGNDGNDSRVHLAGARSPVADERGPVRAIPPRAQYSPAHAVGRYRHRAVSRIHGRGDRSRHRSDHPG